MHEPDDQTHFGFTSIPLNQKTAKVAQVFASVAEHYDVMNDLMSLGVHRVWKRAAIHLGVFRQGQQVLDLAGGSGDLTVLISPKVGEKGRVILADINPAMLMVAKRRLQDQGLLYNTSIIQLNAEQLPFPDQTFDRIIIGFGLRNVTDKPAALRSMYRTLKPGGRLIVLEFSKIVLPLLNSIYDAYSFKLLPKLGQLIANDADSYRYLVESIRRHPDQETLQRMIVAAGFDECSYYNLSAGIVAVHQGMKY